MASSRTRAADLDAVDRNLIELHPLHGSALRQVGVEDLGASEHTERTLLLRSIYPLGRTGSTLNSTAVVL